MAAKEAAKERLWLFPKMMAEDEGPEPRDPFAYCTWQAR